MKISSELSTGVKLTGTTVTADAPRRAASGVQSVEDTDRSGDQDPPQPDMKDAGIGRKLDIKV